MFDKALPNSAESAWKPYLPFAHPVIWDALKTSFANVYSKVEDPRGYLTALLNEIDQVQSLNIEPGTPIQLLAAICKIDVDFLGNPNGDSGRPEVIQHFMRTMPTADEQITVGFPPNTDSPEGSPNLVYTIIGDEMWTGLEDDQRGYLITKESFFPITKSYLFEMTYLSSREVENLRTNGSIQTNS